jgi:hypothetical protein
MNEKDFRELQLRAICPNAEDWSTEYEHEKALVAAARKHALYCVMPTRILMRSKLTAT